MMRPLLRLTTALLLLASCSHRTFEQVERTHDTLTVIQQRTDSVVHKDSVFCHVYSHGDTVYSVTERWNVRYHDRVRIDTVYVAKVNTVTEKKTETKTKVPAWVPWLIAAILLLAIIVMVWTEYKFFKSH